MPKRTKPQTRKVPPPAPSVPSAPCGAKERFLIAEYCNSPIYMGWHLYIRDNIARQQRNADGSWGWVSRGHWKLPDAIAILALLGITMKPGGDGSCDDDGYAELARRFPIGRQRIGGKPRGCVRVMVDKYGGMTLAPTQGAGGQEGAGEGFSRAAEVRHG